MLQAYTQYLPGLVQVTGEQITPYSRAQLESQRELAPEWSQLQTELYDKYGGELNRIGADILKQNALAQAGSDLAVVEGPGRQLVQQGIETQRLADPEWFKARELAGDQLGNLLNSIDLNGLTGSERAEMERALAQEQAGRGIATAPSNIATLEAANQFGTALQNKRNALSQALTSANQFLQTSRSGVDAFQVATGRGSMPNPGNQQFQGVDRNTGQDVMGMSNNFMNQVGENQRTAMGINANRRDSLDRVNETMTSTGNLLGGL